MNRSTTVHCRREQFDVYIGRPSKWGNPFEIGRDGTREQVISKYRCYLKTRPELLKELGSLKGKRLGCWCAPKPCHGDVLIEFAYALEDDLSKHGPDAASSSPR